MIGPSCASVEFSNSPDFASYWLTDPSSCAVRMYLFRYDKPATVAFDSRVVMVRLGASTSTANKYVAENKGLYGLRLLRW